MRPEPEAWAGQFKPGVPALGNRARSRPSTGTVCSDVHTPEPDVTTEGAGPSWERTDDPDPLIFAVEPAPSTAWAGGQGLLCTRPWPGVTLSRACLLSLPPCLQASWVWTCLRSTSFASNPWARPQPLATPAQLCSDLSSAPMGPGSVVPVGVILVTMGVLGTGLGRAGSQD